MPVAPSFADEDFRPTYTQRRDRHAAAFVASLVGLALDVSPNDLLAKGRAVSATVRARKIALYLAHVGFAWPFQRVASAFRLSASTAADACRTVEDLRDDPTLDALISDLETCIGCAPAEREA